MYGHEVLTFDDPVFRFPVSYLITMINSPRRESYLRELRAARPTRTVIVLHNPGRAHKPGVDSSRADIWHANREVFRATRHIADPVLVMEDDVLFAPREQLLAHAARIEGSFRSGTELYFLGCVPLVSAATPEGDLRMLLAGMAHATVYSARARERGMQMALVGVHDVMVSAACVCRAPLRPLAAQPHPRTPNAREWGRFCYWYMQLHAADRRPWAFYERHHAAGRAGGVLLAPLWALCFVAAVAHAAIHVRTVASGNAHR